MLPDFGFSVLCEAERTRALEYLDYSISHKDFPKVELFLKLQWNIDTQSLLG